MADSDNSEQNQPLSGGLTDQLAQPDAAQPEKEGEDISLVGRTLSGKYRILEKLGQGGMGVVYKAEQAYVDRIVAIKILHSHLTSNQNFLKRFHHEARISSRIVHPNAVKLFDFGVEAGMPYLVLEFVEGVTLKEILAREGALPLNRINGILKHVGGALTAAHELEIVHRDLKPDNIMLTQGPNGIEDVRVLDFGIAKALHGEKDQQTTVVTQAGVLMGTPAYISPELALERELDARSDIYSLGVILFEMLTGEVPFRSTSPLETYIQHVRNQPPLMRELKPDLHIPAAISDVVTKALAKDPADRFQNVAELLQAFENAIPAAPRTAPASRAKSSAEPSALSSAGSSAAGIPLSTASEKPGKRRNTVLWASLGLTATAVLAFFAVPKFLEKNAVPAVEESASPTGAESDAQTAAPAAAENAAEDRASSATAPVVAHPIPNPVDAANSAPEVSPQPQLDIEVVSAGSGEAAGQSANDPTARASAPVVPPAEEQTENNAAPQPADLQENTAQTETTSAQAVSENTAPAEAVQVHTEQADAGTTESLSTNSLSTNSLPTDTAKENAPQAADEPTTDQTAAQTTTVENNTTSESAQTTADDPAAALLVEGSTGTESKKSTAEIARLLKSAQSLMDKKEYLPAGLELRKVLDAQPDHLEARLSLGLVLLRLDKLDAARSQYEKALAVDPQYAPSYYSLASYYALSNNPDKAFESLEKAAKLFPGVKKWLASDKDFTALHADPRYQNFLSAK
jgi:serine/threonine-protein kinase